MSVEFDVLNLIFKGDFNKLRKKLDEEIKNEIVKL